VWDILLLESRGEDSFEVTGVSKTTAIKPTGRARGTQIGDGMGGLVRRRDLSQVEVTTHCSEPSQGSKAITDTSESGRRLEASRSNHGRQGREERGKVKCVQSG
jgi:hypothetical protein